LVVNIFEILNICVLILVNQKIQQFNFVPFQKKGIVKHISLFHHERSG